MDWFKHRIGEFTNVKYQRLFEEFGATGYGLYWIIKEYLHMNEFIPKTQLERLAKICKVTENQIQRFFEVCIEEGILNEEDGRFVAEFIASVKKIPESRKPEKPLPREVRRYYRKQSIIRGKRKKKKPEQEQKPKRKFKKSTPVQQEPDNTDFF